MTVEVRTDTGKFVNTAWKRLISNRMWWLVIGFHDTVVTVIETEKHGLGNDIVRGGSLYEIVERVNQKLIADSE